MLLLGCIAWLVTRQVVSPVRMAARTAERFSAGRLEERMAVEGEDDLSKLATSFNQMAGSLQGQIRQLEDELGVKLFERTPRGLSLTQAGQRVLPDVSSAFAMEQIKYATALPLNYVPLEKDKGVV